MNMLFVKKFSLDAFLPTVAHPGEDLGYDLYALNDTRLWSGAPQGVYTGIGARAYRDAADMYRNYGNPIETMGLLIRDRSSMALKGITVSGGVIDPGYTGEIKVILTFTHKTLAYYDIKRGEKIAQMIPIPILTGVVTEVETFVPTSRGDGGFGSSGR